MSTSEILAFDPDDDPAPYEPMIADLTKRPISRDAQRRLAELYIEAYRRTILDRGDFPYRRATVEGADIIGTTAGVIETVAMLNTMTAFTEGLAAGRGSPVVEVTDVERMQEELCDAWPECSKMRVDAAARTLSALVSKLRRSR